MPSSASNSAMPSSASSSAVPPAAQLLPAADMDRLARSLREGVPPGSILAKLRAQGVADPEAIMRALEAQLLPAEDMERFVSELREEVPPSVILAKLRARGVADPEAVMRALEAQRAALEAQRGAGARALANRTRGRSGARKKTRRRRR